jgi:hypothetical protein
VLIDKLPFHVFLNGIFLLLGTYVVFVQAPHAMRWFNVALLLFGCCCFVITVSVWLVVKTYDTQRRWCRSFVPLTYAALAVIFGSSFGFEVAGEGFVRGWGPILLVIVGLSLLAAASTVKPKLGRWLSSSIGGLSAAGGMMLSQSGGGHWFVFLLFCPLTAGACALLGVVAWRDGSY